MYTIQRIFQPDANLACGLQDIWKSSVSATHTFLSPGEIEALSPEVHKGLLDIEQLYVYLEEGCPRGFLGMEGEKVEILFVDAVARGRGIGKALLRYAMETLNARAVDVNEQNAQGLAFYLHMGFSVQGRSPLDGQGRPYPLLHLRLKETAPKRMD